MKSNTEIPMFRREKLISEWEDIKSLRDEPARKIVYKETRTIECYWNGEDMVRTCDPFDFTNYKPKKEWKPIDE